MGSGKTTWAINYINDNPDKSFCFVTPFLSEIERIKSSCGNDFSDPKFINGRKIEGFNFLLQSGRNIAVTHSTFANSNAETMQYIKDNDYILILDEVLEILIAFNDVAQTKIKEGDINVLLDKKLIEVDCYGRVKWIDKSYKDTAYSDVERLAKNGNLLLLNGTLLVWQFPPQMFDVFSEVYILTFMFNASFLQPYFHYHGIDYELVSMSDGKITPYTPVSRSIKDKIASLIQLDTDKARNNYKGTSLSKTWFKNANSKTKDKLKSNITNYINNVMKCKSSEVMWTTYKSARKALKGKGYTRRTIPEQVEQSIINNPDMTDAQKNSKLENLRNCFVPCNCRASNDYRDRSVLVYAVNLSPNPYVCNYFQNKNETDGTDIHVDKDAFCLVCMLQWIWRSRIRDGKPINLYIVSTRARNLLIEWLNS